MPRPAVNHKPPPTLRLREEKRAIHPNDYNLGFHSSCLYGSQLRHGSSVIIFFSNLQFLQYFSTTSFFQNPNNLITYFVIYSPLCSLHTKRSSALKIISLMSCLLLLLVFQHPFYCLRTLPLLNTLEYCSNVSSPLLYICLAATIKLLLSNIIIFAFISVYLLFKQFF